MTARRSLPLAIASLMFLSSFGLAGCAREPADATADVGEEEVSAPADAAPAVPPPAVAAAASDKPATAVQESAALPVDADAEAPSKSDASLERLTQLPTQDQLPAGK